MASWGTFFQRLQAGLCPNYNGVVRHACSCSEATNLPHNGFQFVFTPVLRGWNAFIIPFSPIHTANFPCSTTYIAGNTNITQFDHNTEISDSPVAHLDEHWVVKREVVSSRLRPEQHSGSLNN